MNAIKTYTILLSALAISLLTSCADQDTVEEPLPATVRLSLKASERVEALTSEVWLFDANGCLEQRYTDCVNGQGITFATRTGRHRIVVFLNAQDHAVEPQQSEPGRTHISEVAATPQSGENPFLWVGTARESFTGGSSEVEIVLHKASSVAPGMVINAWTHHQTEVAL